MCHIHSHFKTQVYTKDAEDFEGPRVHIPSREEAEGCSMFSFQFLCCTMCLFVVYLVHHFSSFMLLVWLEILLFKMVQKCSFQVLFSVPSHKKIVTNLVEKICILDMLYLQRVLVLSQE